MTKERKAAISQWRDVLAQLLRMRYNPTSSCGFSVPRYIYKNDMGYDWRANCWFCTYIRKHGEGSQGCERCPLFKYSVAHKPSIRKFYPLYTRDYCGCTGLWSLYERVKNTDNDINDRIAACKLIIQALQGQQIWTYETKEEVEE